MNDTDILIPNWNGRKFLEIVLPSLRKQKGTRAVITTVDNGSTDDSLAYLAEEWPEVNVVALPTNQGFAKAMNRAIAETSAEFVVFLNNDMELDPCWLSELLKPLRSNAELAFTTSKILQFHNHKLLDEAGQDVSVYGLTVPRGLNVPDTGQYETPIPVMVGTGGASAFRRSLLEELSGFDEGYFFYYEDVDLCLRARWLGHRGEYVPTAVVYHYGGGSSGRLSRFTRKNITRNLLITILKDFPLHTLTAGFPNLLFHQLRLLSGARKDHWLGSWLFGWLAFLAAVPATLVKRRQVMKTRRIPASEFLAGFLHYYPLPTKLKKP